MKKVLLSLFALFYFSFSALAQDTQQRPEAEVAKILRGKVPGVDITSTGGVAGSGTNTISRGFSFITDNSQLLFIIDGVPVDNSSQFNSLTTTARIYTAANINLDNIESITVLKGEPATTLYGIRATNGAIVITTKKAFGVQD